MTCLIYTLILQKGRGIRRKNPRSTEEIKSGASLMWINCHTRHSLGVLVGHTYTMGYYGKHILFIQLHTTQFLACSQTEISYYQLPVGYTILRFCMLYEIESVVGHYFRYYYFTFPLLYFVTAYCTNPSSIRWT